MKKLTLIASAAALTLLAACNRPADDTTAGQKIDETIAGAEQRSEDAAATAERKMEESGAAIQRSGERVADATADASLTAKVKSALLSAPEIAAMKIDVDTQAGVVTLKGEVKNTDEKVRAERVASAVVGVQSVVNDLRVSS
jgi:osmotically-inducible protein OsmY